MKRKILMVFMILLMLTQAFSSVEFAVDKKNILIIHSYYQHFAWTYSLQQGIEKELEKEYVDYYLEYLDEHRLTGNKSSEEIFKMMKDKYKNKHFDCVVVADNFSYDFVREYYDQLFKDIPLVLVGINNMKKEMYFNENMTGIAQTADHSRMIKLVKQLHPNMSKLVIAGSNNYTSKNEAASYRTAVKSCGMDKETDFINVEYLEDLYVELNKYDKDTVVIITSLILDKKKTMNLGPMYISNIINNSGLPVYVAVDVMMGHEGEGAVGGYIVDGGVHGARAAKMVNEIMHGEKASNIPIVWESIATPQFNYSRLKQFQIDLEALPEDSEIFGAPISGMVIREEMVVLYSGILVVLFGLSAVLVYQMLRRKRVEMDLIVKQDELRSSNDILIKKNSEIDFLLNNDNITNFNNRNHFIHLVDENLKKKDKLIMYAVYVRNIKQVDDAYGYQLGDEARLEVSKIIREIFSGNEVIFARYYDTFYIVDEESKVYEENREYLRKLELMLQQNIKVKGYDLSPKIKLGIVRSSEGDTGLGMLQKADITILNAMLNEQTLMKEYNKSFHHKLEEKIKMENDIKTALKKKEFFLHFQPQVNTNNDDIVSCEALIRWQRGDGKNISPSVFIPLSEEIGLIHEIGDWIINEACSVSKTWKSQGIMCPISINMSAKQINPKLVSTVERAMGRFDVKGEDLIIEITETSVMDDTQNNIRILRELSDLGIRIALDDFGIGHSSLKYIMDFPIDKLKIDKSFVDNIVNPEQHAIVKAMYELGKVFQYDVIAEGVETDEQMDAVKRIGIEEVQGWYYSKALPDEAFRNYYRKR